MKILLYLKWLLGMESEPKSVTFSAYLWKLEKDKPFKRHRIGKHGAVGMLTREGYSICTECGKKIIK